MMQLSAQFPSTTVNSRHMLAAERLRRGERVTLESTDDDVNAVLRRLGSAMRVREQVRGTASSAHPHIEAGVEVRSATARFSVRTAHRVSGGSPLLFAGATAVCAEERIHQGVLVVAPPIAPHASFDEHGRLETIERITGVPTPLSKQASALFVDRIPVVETGGWTIEPPARAEALAGPAMMASIRRAVRELPEHVVEAVLSFQEAPHQSGALLLRGCPVGELPATPETPTTPCEKDRTSEHTLLSVGRLLGQIVGYLPEHGGDIVQSILPTRSGADRQVSTSSRATLLYHTEAAFHPWRPRWLLLLCLRGDASAKTTLVSVHDLVGSLDEHTLRVLSEARFRTGIDESYAGKRSSSTSETHPVLSGTRSSAFLRYDAELTRGVDAEAESALAVLNAAVGACEGGVVLEPGDLLIVDNTVAIHGRSPFTPRFDGTDRWLQRSFVLADLQSAASELEGRIVATQFRS